MVADFGMSRMKEDKQSDSAVTKQTVGPLKWMVTTTTTTICINQSINQSILIDFIG